ncbi:hypothetical protein SAY86_014499 [Trapa natans]|uniref:DNA polymerase zeta catalytic subunit n=1 Tax=Trapa natans TaxID=22666 RepID=A0AAN7KWK4_TRANT|nr:hypothetical protein SAY86_014499 [Trapa natans]
MVSSQPDSYIFSVRIVSIDYYMAPPLPVIDIGYSSFQGEKVNEVPVIRVYGSTPAGQKTCLHVHQALPYLYVPCADIPLPLTMEGNSYINTVCLAIEKALKLSGNAAAKRQHVHCSSIVRAKRFYGYHSSEELFVKIYFYNPHDIGRAAQLLLVGAVFDRSLQPHESHVPYLLQFMVDYNLYGMGHLHVNKMKFRNPIPSSFSSKLFNYNSELSQDSSKSQQEDLIGDAHLKTPVWVTSTVPENWRWQIHGDDESLSDQTIGRVKRQSVCELEGDAAVVDIVNQQFKMYQSLSQARSDLKMVQSLVPIWEEFEKMGMHVAEIPPDLGKPSSEYVLKSLSLGLELEQKLVDLCDHVESVLGSTPLEQNARTMDSIQPLSDEKKMIDCASANQSHNYSEPLQHLEERHGSLSSRDLLHEDKNAPMLAHGNYLHRDSFFLENNLSQLTDITKKATDEEALGLLKWLATSQAVEDINSDDELAPEVILSPLMPATTVDKVLEKAFMDYETESQRECQDIIDSVDNVIDFEGLEETVDSNCSGPSPKKRVPQLDGSSDDFYSFPHPESAEPSSELARTNEEKFSHKQSSHHVGKCSTKKKMNSSSWGSLPVSTTPMLLDKSETKNFDISDGSSSEDHIQNLTCCSLNTQNKSGKYLEISKDVNSLARCSVRDLMRKKRQHRFESYSSFSEQKKDLSLCPETKQLSQMLEENDGHMELWPHPCSLKQQNDVLETGNSFKTSTTVIEKLGFSAYLNCESETVADVGLKPVVPDYTCVMEEKTRVPSSKIHNPEISIKHHGMCEGSNIISKSNSDASSCKPDNLLSNMEYSYRDKLLVDSVQSVDACSFEFKESSLASELICKQMCCDDAHCDEIILRSCSSPMPFENLESHNGANEARKDLQFVCGKQVGDEAGFSTAGASSALNLMNKPSGIISISFHEKPPIVDGNYDVLDDIAPAKAVFDRSSLIPSMGFSGNVLDEIPPFFMDSFQPDKELQKLHNNGLTEDELSCHQKVVNGSPTHNLNDGSHLYLLTPIISPPSVDAINNWLSPDQGSSAPPVVSTHGSSYEDCNISVQRPNSTSIYPTPEEDVYYRKEAKSNSKTDVLDCGARIVFPSEESPAKLNIDDIFTPDISQISGPDRKSGSIPLSQLGFQDPASVGAGQQLTIMSVEVQAESRGDLCPDPRFDAINVLTVALMADNDPLVEIYVLLYSRSDFHPRSRYGLSDCKVFVFVEEKQLLLHFIKIISKSNPDILVGWDVQGGSIGFLAERASYLGIGLLNLISRTPSENKMVGDYEHLNESMLENVHPDSLLTDSGLVEEVIRDEWGRTHASGLHVGGRIVLNLWRCMRCEVKLYLYTLEAVAEAVLRQKTPSIPHKILTNWFSSGSGRARYRCIEYLIKRTKLNLQILDKLDLVLYFW